MNTYQQERTGTRILELSDFFSRLPFGHKLRNRFIKKTIRFSRQIDCNVEHLLPGHCITSISESLRIQNEHYAIHESAIASMAEHASRLALLTGLPENATANLTTFSIQHLKPAHGKLLAECRAELPERHVAKEYQLLITVKDAAETTVARAAASWLVNPTSKGSELES